VHGDTIDVRNPMHGGQKKRRKSGWQQLSLLISHEDAAPMELGHIARVCADEGALSDPLLAMLLGEKALRAAYTCQYRVAAIEWKLMAGAASSITHAGIAAVVDSRMHWDDFMRWILSDKAAKHIQAKRLEILVAMQRAAQSLDLDSPLALEADSLARALRSRASLRNYWTTQLGQVQAGDRMSRLAQLMEVFDVQMALEAAEQERKKKEEEEATERRREAGRKALEDKKRKAREEADARRRELEERKRKEE